MKLRMVPTLLVPVAIFLLAADAKEDAAQAEFKKLEGTWKLVSMELRGKPLPPKEVADKWLRFADGKLTAKDAKETKVIGTVKLDPSTNPKSLEITRVQIIKRVQPKGKENEVVEDKVISVDRGIYELDGDKLKLCVTNGRPGKRMPRPTEFKSKPGQNSAYFVLEREKN